jgi:hypothetical protein
MEMIRPVAPSSRNAGQEAHHDQGYRRHARRPQPGRAESDQDAAGESLGGLRGGVRHRGAGRQLGTENELAES